jgi:hypothetical protein
MKTFQIPKYYMGLRYFKDLFVDWSKVLKQILKKRPGGPGQGLSDPVNTAMYIWALWS